MAEFPHILACNALSQAVVSSTVIEDPVFRLVHLTDRSRLSKWSGPWSGYETTQEIRWSFSTDQVCAGGVGENLDTFVLDRSFRAESGVSTQP